MTIIIVVIFILILDRCKIVMSGSPVKKGQKRPYPGHNFSEDDPLGLNLNADEILYGENDNEGKTEKEPIPKNVNDPLGLDSKPDSKCKSSDGSKRSTDRNPNFSHFWFCPPFWSTCSG